MKRYFLLFTWGERGEGLLSNDGNDTLLLPGGRVGYFLLEQSRKPVGKPVTGGREMSFSVSPSRSTDSWQPYPRAVGTLHWGPVQGCPRSGPSCPFWGGWPQTEGGGLGVAVQPMSVTCSGSSLYPGTQGERRPQPQDGGWEILFYPLRP